MSKQPLENKILLTPTEARQLLGVGRTEMYALCRTKGFPAFKIKTRIYVNKDKLKEWADKQCEMEEV